MFYDHSSGHEAYSADALVVNRLNIGPDWKRKVAPMRDGQYVCTSVDGAKSLRMQRMQFLEGDILPCDMLIPPGVDPSRGVQEIDTNDAAGGGAQDGRQDAPPPSEIELQAAFRKFFQGAAVTIKKHNPGKTSAEVDELGKQKWASLPTEHKMVFVSRVRAQQRAGPVTPASERVLKAGAPVPPALWGRNEGMQAILCERGLYPAVGLRATCENAEHRESNACCCSRLLGAQLDFAAECSALQHAIEERITIQRTFQPVSSGSDIVSTARHSCLFLPKV